MDLDLFLHCCSLHSPIKCILIEKEREQERKRADDSLVESGTASLFHLQSGSSVSSMLIACLAVTFVCHADNASPIR